MTIYGDHIRSSMNNKGIDLKMWLGEASAWCALHALTCEQAEELWDLAKAVVANQSLAHAHLTALALQAELSADKYAHCNLIP